MTDASSARAAGYWFYLVGRNKIGPVDFRAISEAIGSGIIVENTQVWQKGMESWAPAIETSLNSFWADRPPPLPNELTMLQDPQSKIKGVQPSPKKIDSEAKVKSNGFVAEFLSFSGRIGRVRWFVRNILMALVIGVLAAMAKPVSEELVGLLYCLLVYLALVNAAKRLHDFDAPGWLCPIALIPIVCLILLFKGGTYGTNKYGDEP